MCSRKVNLIKWSNRPGECGGQCSNCRHQGMRPTVLLTMGGLDIIPVSHMHWHTVHWRSSPTLVFHTMCMWSLVLVRPTETAVWQSREWIIALLASRTHHTHDNNYEPQNTKWNSEKNQILLNEIRFCLQANLTSIICYIPSHLMTVFLDC